MWNIDLNVINIQSTELHILVSSKLPYPLQWFLGGLCLFTYGTKVTPSFPVGHMLTQPLYLTKLNFLLHCLGPHHQNRAR